MQPTLTSHAALIGISPLPPLVCTLGAPRRTGPADRPTEVTDTRTGQTESTPGYLACVGGTRAAVPARENRI